MKPSKAVKFSHTPKSKIGHGDNYGTGVKQKVGRVLEDTIGFTNVSPRKLKKPPRSMA